MAESKWDLLPHGAVCHVTRIARVLRFQWDCGHLLLVGRPGSRRTELVKLAAGVLGFETATLGFARAAGTHYTRQDLLRELIDAVISHRVCGREQQSGLPPQLLLIAPDAVTQDDNLLEQLHQ
eukprot:7254303-Pyramimonas_sp.AAC.1